MAKVTWRQLHDLKLGGLADYIDVWDKTNKGIKDAIDDAENVVEPGVKKAFGGFADIEVFSSGAQAATKALTKLTDQLDDAKTEGDAVEEVLRAGQEDLKGVRGRFRDRVGEINNAKPDIDGAGSYSVDLDNQVVNVPARPSDEKWNHTTTIEEWNNAYQPKAEAYAEELDDLIKEADEIDQEVSNTLSGISRNRPEFNSEADEMEEEFSKERQEADAEKVEDRLTDGEITEADIEYANDMMKKHDGEEYFAVKLFDDLGAKGLAEVYGQAAIDSPASDKEMEKFQKYLGTSLATATDPDNNGPHLGKDYLEEFTKAGAELITIGGDPDDPGSGRAVHGYQMLAPLLKHGNFDEDFIVPTAEHIMAMDYMGIEWEDNLPGVFDYDDSTHPVNAVLEGVGKNAVAAASLFSNGEGSAHYEFSAEHDKVLKDFDPLTFVLEDEQLDGSLSGIDKSVVDDTIEAACTGIGSEEELSGEDRPLHTKDNVEVTEKLMKYIGEKPGDFDGPDSKWAALVDNLGDITVNYREDFYNAYSEESDLFESHGETLDLGSYEPPKSPGPAITQWMQVIGHSPTEMAEVLGGMEATMHEALAGSDSSDTSGMVDSVEPFGRIAGELTNGYFEAIDSGSRFDSTYEDTLRSQKDGIKWAIGETAGRIPVVGNSLSTLFGMEVDDIYKSGADQDKVEFAANWRDKIGNGDQEWVLESLEKAGVPADKQEEIEQDILRNLGLEYFDYTEWPRDKDGNLVTG